jgi:hypothetical protein
MLKTRGIRSHGPALLRLLAGAAMFAAGWAITPSVALADSGKHGKPPSPIPCSDLARLTLPEALSITAKAISAGTFTLPPPLPPDFPAAGIPNLPAFCRVSIVVAPKINIEVWLPTTTWNKRFQGVGGGGYAGAISWSALGDALRAGYATASTDTGHQSSAPVPALDGSFAFNADGTLNWGLIEDFASRSLFQMTAKAQIVTRVFYGAKPKYSYWSGCSTGGRQGLMQVQRTPDAYDGVMAGAPAINWDRFIPAELWPQIVMKEEVGRPIEACKLTLANDAALAACDALDGVADGIIEDPRRCDFDPKVLLCKQGAAVDCNCLTGGEVRAMRGIWDGARSTKGRRLWYGAERTTALSGPPFGGLAGPVPFPIAVEHTKWAEQNPAFDWQTLDYVGFQESFLKSRLLFNRVIGTDDPDLSLFRKSGGKLIVWHGWVDSLIFPRGAIDYYERVLDRMGGPERVQKFARLFMAPGVDHCFGGPGPNVFDMFAALVAWVEKEQAPDRIIASRIENGQVTRTRPLCPYPAVATYKGTGSTDDAGNFACRNPRDHERGHGD